MSGDLVELRFDPTPEETIRELQKLEEALQAKGLRTGMVAAIAPVKRTMKVLAPKLTGRLAGGVGHAMVSKSAQGRIGQGGQMTILVGVTRNKQGYKAIYQEYGTELMSANPFIFPAWQQHEGGFESRFYTGLQKFLDKQ